MSASPKNPSLRVLHLSDLHERVALDWMTTDRKRKIRNSKSDRHAVLGPELEQRLRAIVDERPPDLLVFTGDLADWGLHEEYIAAERRLNGLLKLLGLGWDRVFLVPGNHDIQRKVEETCWAEMRAFAADPHNRDRLSRWLAGEECPVGAPQAGLSLPAKRQSGYRAFLQRINRPELLPDDSRGHPNLGYRQTLTLPNLPPVHIIGLDTAWLAGDDNDKGRLLLTKHQVTQNATNDDGEPLDGLRLALMHHPLSDLGDDNTHRLLSAHMDLVLHGHQHRPVSQEDKNPDRTLRTLAAGSIYEGDEGERWPNSFHVLDIEMNAEGRPLRYVVQFYAWSVEGGHWHEHSALYKNAPNGRLVWETELGRATPREAPPPAARPVALANFVGRVEELAALQAHLTPTSPPTARICAVFGMAGVGKSFLVAQLVAQRGDRFPKGVAPIILGAHELPTEAGLVESIAVRLGVERGAGPALDRVRAVLATQQWLLHIDNIDEPAQGHVVVALVQRLGAVACVLTGRCDLGGAARGWRRIRVAAFSEVEALAQLHGELGAPQAPLDDAERTAHRDLVGALGFLPLAIHLAASYLREGRHSVASYLRKLTKAGLTLEPCLSGDTAYEDRAERSLAASFELSREALTSALGDEATLGMPAICALGVAPLGGAGLSWLAAIMGADEDQANDWLAEATKLSIVQQDAGARRWRVHKLLGKHLLGHGDEGAAVERMDGWVLERLPDAPEETRGGRWRALQAEHDAVAEWVAGLDGERAVVGGRVGFYYAFMNGPYAAWLCTVARGLNTTTDAEARSNLLWCQGNLARQAGDLDLTLRAAEAYGAHGAAQDRDVALAAGLRADVHQMRGQLDEALRIRREEEIPVYEQLGDLHSKVATLGKIADVLQAQGQLDDARRIWEEEVFPAILEFGDERDKAGMMGKIADLLQAQGELDEALRIRREQMLPVFDQLGEMRERAFTVGKIADVLAIKGRIDDALRIRREEELPVYERIGDVRSKAVAMGKIADLLQTRGQLDEALRIRREEELPVYERLGNVHDKAITMGKIADVLQARGQLDEALRIRREEVLPVIERLGDVREKAGTMSQIADVYQVRGQRDEALRIHTEEVIPVYERLNAVRERAVIKGKIANVLRARGQHDEALRIWTKEVISVFEQLGDVRSQAATLSQIADVHQARGQLNEALRIRREEVLPVFEQLGDVRSQAVTLSQIADVHQARGQLDEALRIRREEVLPVFERLDDVHGWADTMSRCAEILEAQGRREDAIRILRDDVLPACRSLGDRQGLLKGQTNLAFALLRTRKPKHRHEARTLLTAALASALELNLPVEATQIRSLFARHNMKAPTTS